MATGPVGVFRAGKGGAVNVNSTVCNMKKFSVTESAGDLDTTNFESWTDEYGSSGSGGGISFEQGLVGVLSAKFDIDGNWDAAQDPYDPPVGFYPRDDGPQVVTYINFIDTTYFQFFATRFLTGTVATATADLVTFAISGKNQGPYQRPTGSVTS